MKLISPSYICLDYRLIIVYSKNYFDVDYSKFHDT